MMLETPYQNINLLPSKSSINPAPLRRKKEKKKRMQNPKSKNPIIKH